MSDWYFFVKAVCEWGRESLESWGRRKRSINNVTDEEKEEDMTLSQEILVLDFGDDKQSEFLKSELSSADFSKGRLEFILHCFSYNFFFFR